MTRPVRSRGVLIRQIAAHAVLITGAIFILLPFVWMILTSIRSPSEIFDASLWPFPRQFYGHHHYVEAMTAVPLFRFMLNGVIVCAGILIVQLLVSIPAAYALAKLRFPGSGLFFASVIAALCVPMQVLALPLFIGLAEVGMLNTYFAMMMPFFVSVFAIFLFRQTFKTFPDEIIQAARIDGFTEMEICWRLVVPASKAAISAFTVFSVVAHWNDLYWPLIVVSDTRLAPPPLGMLFFTNAEAGSNYGALMAGATVLTAPLVICFLLARRRFIEGITMTGVK